MFSGDEETHREVHFRAVELARQAAAPELGGKMFLGTRKITRPEEGRKKKKITDPLEGITLVLGIFQFPQYLTYWMESPSKSPRPDPVCELRVNNMWSVHLPDDIGQLEEIRNHIDKIYLNRLKARYRSAVAVKASLENLK